jgi:hypothetical protein
MIDQAEYSTIENLRALSGRLGANFQQLAEGLSEEDLQRVLEAKIDDCNSHKKAANLGLGK